MVAGAVATDSPIAVVVPYRNVPAAVSLIIHDTRIEPVPVVAAGPARNFGATPSTGARFFAPKAVQ